MGNVFRHPKTNARWTKQLFWDNQNQMANEDKTIEPRFTLHHDKPGLVNFRSEYVRLNDTTGYKLANLYLENYDHFLLLMKCNWFKKAKELWDVELEAKLRSEGLNTIRELNKDGEDIPLAIRLQAAKYLASGSFKTSSEKKSPRGRPTNDEVEGERKRMAEDDKDLLDDLARIRVVK